MSDCAFVVKIRSIEENPPVFQVVCEATGEVVNTFQMNSSARQFGAYVDATGQVVERDFGKACEAVKKLAERGQEPGSFQLTFGEPAARKR